MDKHYIYHPDYDPMVVETDEYEKLLGMGWYDSPAKFPTKSSEDEQPRGESIEEGQPRKRGRPPKERVDADSI